jgi:hypothetical protein
MGWDAWAVPVPTETSRQHIVTVVETKLTETKSMKWMEKTSAKVVSRIDLERGIRCMSRYTDSWVVCPFYAYEESNKARKIHCEGYRKGVHVHLYFKTKQLKKTHKQKFCKNSTTYQKCPLYQGNLRYHTEDDDNE